MRWFTGSEFTQALSDMHIVKAVPRVIRATLLLLAAGACAPAASVGPPPITRDPSAEYKFYDVVGDSPGALWRSMRESGPPPADGFPALGRTDWNVTWRASWDGAGICQVRNADVRLQTTITLPRWNPPATAPAALVAQWDAFLRALSVHEAGHAEIGSEAARVVRRELERVTAPDCASMNSRTQEAVGRVLEDFRAGNRSYDAQTRHGVTQGAVWPPRS
jgi:predicted secreted Zn-dependent protease